LVSLAKHFHYNVAEKLDEVDKYPGQLLHSISVKAKGNGTSCIFLTVLEISTTGI
jgi:hypothetical protein